jgi:hypothetical protein
MSQKAYFGLALTSSRNIAESPLHSEPIGKGVLVAEPNNPTAIAGHDERDV